MDLPFLLPPRAAHGTTQLQAAPSPHTPPAVRAPHASASPMLTPGAPTRPPPRQQPPQQQQQQPQPQPPRNHHPAPEPPK